MVIYISRNNQRYGPYQLEHVQADLDAGNIVPTDHAWYEGAPAWTRVSEIPGIKLPETRIPPPPPPSTVAASGPLTTPQDGVISEELLRLFVGPNYEYYVRKWKILQGKRSPNSWNWAAFFAGLAWMAYRKMYRYSWFFIAAIVVEELFELAFNFPASLSNAINIAIAATYGWQGNYWYKLHCERKLREIAPSGVADNAARLCIAREGGTNIGAGIGFVAVAVILLFIMAALTG